MTKRFLTRDEITFILNDIHPIICMDIDISNNIFDAIIKNLTEQLEHVEIYPDMIEELKSIITKKYYKGQVLPGESVGVLTAQNIGERQTQLTLNTFHSAGITTGMVVTGVPRFSELLNATKKPKNVVTHLFFKNPVNEEEYSIERLKEIVQTKFEYIIIKKLIEKIIPVETDSLSLISQLYIQMNESTVPSVLPSSEILETYKYILQLKFNMNLLYKHKIRLKVIAKVIMDAYDDIICIPSPDIMGYIDILSQSRSEEFIFKIVIPNIVSLQVSGIPYLTNPFYGPTNVSIMGNNLKQLLSHELIDDNKTISNNMWEIYDTLGIEATRDFLFHEFMNIVASDTYINKRHVELLVDVMTYNGTIMSVSRYGIQSDQFSVLAKCSFEESLEQIIKAGMNGEVENTSGVSASIICGKLSNIGTGLIDLLYSPKS